ncbi:MAG: amidohydrolase [Betaproteobacteria bacterium]|nr:amidohydrolase [Betaproteobacteria bacterium]
MTPETDPQGSRLPIKLDSTSNGEFFPIPLDATQVRANQWAHSQASDNAKRRGLDRRGFLLSSCGVASTLLAFNSVNAQAGRTGGHFDLTPEAALDPQLAAASVEGDEFIFDVQGHFVDPRGDWLKTLPAGSRPLSFAPKGQCALGDAGGLSYLNCLSSDEFIKDVFLDSDTDMMVLSFVPSRRDAEPLTIAAADATRQIIDRMEGSHRLLLHGRVNPNQPGDMEDMDELAQRWKINAWKTYTQWGPDGKGFYLDEDISLRMIEKARALGVKVICVHKGIPFGQRSYEHSQCRDIGVVAKMFPDVSFIVYHSGFVPSKAEQAFAPGTGRDGIDTLIQSLLDNGVTTNSNVYAELGSTWRFAMRDPDNAAHTIGKLLKYVGENNVLWGTDSIWYGSPQDQIQAFRTFQISDEYQERHGYSRITPEIRAKVFGLNATKPYRVSAEEVRKYSRGDRIARERQAYAERPQPHSATYGPKTRREFLNLLRWNGGSRA